MAEGCYFGCRTIESRLPYSEILDVGELLVLAYDEHTERKES